MPAARQTSWTRVLSLLGIALRRFRELFGFGKPAERYARDQLVGGLVLLGGRERRLLIRGVVDVLQVFLSIAGVEARAITF